MESWTVGKVHNKNIGNLLIRVHILITRCIRLLFVCTECSVDTVRFNGCRFYRSFTLERTVIQAPTLDNNNGRSVIACTVVGQHTKDRTTLISFPPWQRRDLPLLLSCTLGVQSNKT